MNIPVATSGGAVDLDELLHRRRRGKDEGKEEKPERDAEPGAEHAAEQEDRIPRQNRRREYRRIA